MKPWLLGLLVVELELKHLGFDASKGLDRHFLDEARQMHKPIGALETAEFQVKLLSSLPDDMQDRLLLSSLVEMERSTAFLKLLVRAWQSGAADKMQALLDRDVRKYPQLKSIMEKLFDDRNTAMAKQIEQFLRTSKTYFIAVGAGHLIGDHGILSQLRRKHFTVVQL
jgi:uncharacterized protein